MLGMVGVPLGLMVMPLFYTGHNGFAKRRDIGCPFPQSVTVRYNAVMQVISLQSGSNGNCIYVEADGIRLLFDAGISGSQVKERLAQHGREPVGVDAVLISHDHVDHARSMGILHRKFGLPVYVTANTYRAAHRHRLGEIEDLRHFCSGETLRFGNVRVETIATPHDGADGVVFVVDDGQHRLGILTDLGHVFADLHGIVESLDAVLLESNYDPDMLADGPYPDWLKQRIEGPGGHISNFEAAEVLQSADQRMKWVCLAHLSQDNNTPKLALATHRRILGDRLPLVVASRHEASDILEI
jgi:phosphoribosyl 1,2-cyclic phosphodiesterase